MFFAVLFLAVSAMAQTPKDVKYVYTEASDLNLIGKILEDTPYPYHRVDTIRYKGFTKGEWYVEMLTADLSRNRAG